MKLIFKTSGCIVILLLGIFHVFGQEKELNLRDKRITIKIEKQHLGIVFRYLMENYDISIGFEQSILDKTHDDYDFETNLPKLGVKDIISMDGKVQINVEAERVFEAKQHWITINAENARLEDVLNQIVKQMNNYTWEITDGVVNIFPTKGRDQRFKKLLATNVKTFYLEKGRTVSAITTSIKNLPEFKEFLIENNLYFSGVRSGTDIIIKTQYGRLLYSEMNFSNLTFKQLLNKITKIKKGGWIIKKKRINRINEEHVDIDI